MQAIDQIINSAAKTLYMSGGQMGCSIVFRGPNGAAVARRRPAQPGLLGLVLAGPGPQGGRAVFGRRLQGPAEGRDPRSQSGDLPRKRDAVRPYRRGAEARRLRDPDRQGADRARRQATSRIDLVVERHDLRAEGRRRTGQGRHRGRGDRSAHAAPDGHRHHHRLGEEDRPRGDGGGGLAADRRRRRDRRPHHGARLRLSRRAGGARVRQGRADALCGQPRKARIAHRWPRWSRPPKPFAYR